MKILITGGHPACALAVIEELLKKKSNEVFFVGRKYTVGTERSLSFEYQQVSALHVPFYNLDTGKIHRNLSMQMIRDLKKVINGLIESKKMLQEIQPEAILSFGGYIAVPVAIVGKLMGIPVLTHEQTIAPGLASKFISLFADKILLSFPETIKYFDVHKSKVTGNPLRKSVLGKGEPPFTLDKRKPIIFVMGGSLGAHAINLHIEKLLPHLTKKFTIVHQTGNVKAFEDYERLKKKRYPTYFVKEHFSSEEVAWMMRNADILVSRSGANTTFEIIAHKIPSVLIPLPIAPNGEQEKQAKLLMHAGAAKIFYQDRASEDLLEDIFEVFDNISSYRRSFTSLRKYVKRNAPERIIEEVEELL